MSHETIGTRSRASSVSRHELHRDRPELHDWPVYARSAMTVMKLAKSAPSANKKKAGSTSADIRGRMECMNT
jgi:hypothetical protein